MEKTIKMFMITDDGNKSIQDVPEGLVEIYREKGWIEIEEQPKEEKIFEEKPFFSTKKASKFKNN